MATSFKSMDTIAVRGGEHEPRVNGAVVLPIFQTSTYEYGNDTPNPLRYLRYNNSPNHEELNRKLALLEKAEDAVVTSSGMAAISSALLSVLITGDHLLVQQGVYGGTYSFVTRDCKALGISIDFFNPDHHDSWKDLLKPTTRAIYVEGLTNPLVEAIDHQKVLSFAKEHKLVTLIDNTFLSPINFRPAEIGYDLILHSATKYLNGHSDICAGVVAGKAAIISVVSHKLHSLGGCLDPHACFLLNRGLKTLALRVRHQNKASLDVVKYLSEHNKIKRVYHPFLESHSSSKVAHQYYTGFGGMLSFEIDAKFGPEAAQKFINSVKLAIPAPSLGGPETLVVLPSKSSHASMKKEDRDKIGITDGLIRMSIGLEAPEDLIADLAQALDVI